MLVCNIVSSCCCSRIVRALLWLLLAVVLCVVIVLCLSLATIRNEQDVSTEHVEFAPRPKKGGLIFYEFKDYDNVKTWTSKINHFLSPYKKALDNPHANQVDCSFNKYPVGDQTCKVDIRNFTPCIDGLDFGYKRATPCVFLKFKKQRDWIPEYLSVGNFSEADLDKYIVKDITNNYAHQEPQVMKTVWVSCMGKTKYDTALMGDVNYIPWMGFSGYYLPYHGQEGYLEPLVAVQFSDPRVGIVIDIDCKVVANNFNETVSFRLMIHDST